VPNLLREATTTAPVTATETSTPGPTATPPARQSWNGGQLLQTTRPLLWLRDRPSVNEAAHREVGRSAVLRVQANPPEYNDGYWWWYVRAEGSGLEGWAEEIALIVYVPPQLLPTRRPVIAPVLPTPQPPPVSVPPTASPCNFDFVCQRPQESSASCPSDCPTPLPPNDGSSNGTCNFDFVCQRPQESSASCPSDCSN
jgi:hypothetical protein